MFVGHHRGSAYELVAHRCGNGSGRGPGLGRVYGHDRGGSAPGPREALGGLSARTRTGGQWARRSGAHATPTPVPARPTASPPRRTASGDSEGMWLPALIGGVVAAFAVGLAAGETVRRRRRGAVATLPQPEGKPAVASTAPATVLPAPRMPRAKAAPGAPRATRAPPAERPAKVAPPAPPVARPAKVAPPAPPVARPAKVVPPATPAERPARPARPAKATPPAPPAAPRATPAPSAERPAKVAPPATPAERPARPARPAKATPPAPPVARPARPKKVAPVAPPAPPSRPARPAPAPVAGRPPAARPPAPARQPTPARRPAPPRDDRPVPARRFAHVGAWPDEAARTWTCEIEWKGGYIKSGFCAMAAPPGEARRALFGESRPIKWYLDG